MIECVLSPGLESQHKIKCMRACSDHKGRVCPTPRLRLRPCYCILDADIIVLRVKYHRQTNATMNVSYLNRTVVVAIKVIHLWLSYEFRDINSEMY